MKPALLFLPCVHVAVVVATLALSCSVSAFVDDTTHVPDPSVPDVNGDDLDAWTEMHLGSLGFLPNTGRAGDDAHYVVGLAGMFGECVDGGFRLLDLERATSVHFAFEGPLAGATPYGAGGPPVVVRSYFGNDANSWVPEQNAFRTLRYSNDEFGVHAELDVRDGVLKYSFELDAGLSADAVTLRCSDGTLSIDAAGNLVADTPLGTLVQEAPATFEVDADGTRHAVPCRFRLLDSHTFGFSVERSNTDAALVIDPSLAFVSFVGGPGKERTVALGFGPAASLVVVYGITDNPSGLLSVLPPTAPVVNAAPPTGPVPKYAIFAIGVDPSLSGPPSLKWVTLFGGNDDDIVVCARVDDNGNSFAAGNTRSDNFPTLAPMGATPLQTARAGESDGFVMSLDALGAPVFATYLGDTCNDFITGCSIVCQPTMPAGGCLNVAGIAVSGRTASGGFPLIPLGLVSATSGPLPNGFDCLPFEDAFAAVIDPEGSTLLSSFLMQRDLEIDVTNPHAGTGATVGPMKINPTTGQVAFVFGGELDLIATGDILDPTTIDLMSSVGTFQQHQLMTPNAAPVLHSGHIEEKSLRMLDVDVSSIGTLYITGAAPRELATEANVGMMMPFQAEFGGPNVPVPGHDAGLVIIDSAGTVQYSTFIGGTGNDIGQAVLFDEVTGVVYIAGYTDSLEFGLQGGRDIFLAAIQPEGNGVTDLVSFDVIGGGDDEYPIQLELSPNGQFLCLTGQTLSADFPVPAAGFQPALAGAGDGIVACFDLTSDALFEPEGGNASPLRIAGYGGRYGRATVMVTEAPVAAPAALDITIRATSGRSETQTINGLVTDHQGRLVFPWNPPADLPTGTTVRFTVHVRDGATDIMSTALVYTAP